MNALPMTRVVLFGFLASLAALAACSESSGDEKGGTGGADGGGGTAGVILDGGGTVPDAPAGETFCQKGECNYQKQDCTSGGTCLPSDSPPATGDWPPKCMTAGSRAIGESCSAWNDCVAGGFCVGISGAADGGVVPGTCRKLCCGGDWSACGSGQSCVQQVYLVRPGGGDPVYANADVCVPVNDCDVLDTKSCAEKGKSCQIVDPTGNVACMSAGTGSAGDACGSKKPCQAGFTCVADECRRLCKAVAGGGEPSCPLGEGTCVHYKRDPEGVGECTPLD